MKFRVLIAVCAVFAVAAMTGASGQAVAAESSADMFGCMHEGTKVGKTYIRHTDPAKLEEAVQIFEGNLEDREYPVGTVLQLVPIEAMVKHEKSAYPDSNGWEYLLFDLSSGVTKIAARGVTAANPLGTCQSCHEGAASFDYVCSKDHGCPPIPVTDEQIIGMQGTDPRCEAN